MNSGKTTSKFISGFQRFLLRNFGHYLSDSIYLRALYKIRMGHKMNLKNPKTFQEKIQWLKINYRKPEFTVMVDKYAVKEFVAKKIGKEYIIPTIGVWNRVEDINIEELPNKFVLKTTHGGGGGGVIICRDKSKFDMNKVLPRLNSLLKLNIYKNYREWPYKDVPRRIIAEKFLETSESTDLTDYKIFCFNGKPKYIQVIKDRNTVETIDFFDTHWVHQPFVGLNPKCKNAKIEPHKPSNLEEMIYIAEKLSKDIPFVRVDLYNIDSKVYFGELTFYPASGIGKFSPDEWSLKLGDLLQLPIK